MSNAIIKANKGKGLYSVEVEYDRGAIDARLEQLSAGVESLDEQITDLNERKAEAEAAEAEAEQALKDAFAAYEEAKATMEADKAAAIAASGDTLAQDTAKARGAHDATVDRVDDRVAEAATARQDKVAAANNAYAQAEIDHQEGLDQAQEDYYDCVGDGTDPAVCYDRKQEEIERLDERLAEAAQTRDDAIAAADDEYDDVYRQGQKDIEASESARDNAIAVAEAANEQRIADIEGDFTPLEAPAKAVSDANTALIKDRFPVQRLESQLAELELRKLSLQQQIDLLSGARKERVIDAWCADYTVGLQDGDTAGLIWPNIDANAQPILLPGGAPAADGVVKSELAMGPASSYFNRAIMPIIQRMKPRHMIGSVTAVNDDGTLDVELRGHLSRFGRVDTVINPTLSSVPVEYMRYGAAAFEDGDDVVVTFGGLDQAEPKVIGFEHDPRVIFGFEVLRNGGDSDKYKINNKGVVSEFDGNLPSTRALIWEGRDGSMTGQVFDLYSHRYSMLRIDECPLYFTSYFPVYAHHYPGGRVLGSAVRDDGYVCVTISDYTLRLMHLPHGQTEWLILDSKPLTKSSLTASYSFSDDGYYAMPRSDELYFVDGDNLSPLTPKSSYRRFFDIGANGINELEEINEQEEFTVECSQGVFTNTSTSIKINGSEIASGKVTANITCSGGIIAAGSSEGGTAVYVEHVISLEVPIFIYVEATGGIEWVQTEFQGIRIESMPSSTVYYLYDNGAITKLAQFDNQENVKTYAAADTLHLKAHGKTYILSSIYVANTNQTPAEVIYHVDTWPSIGVDLGSGSTIEDIRALI